MKNFFNKSRKDKGDSMKKKVGWPYIFVLCLILAFFSFAMVGCSEYDVYHNTETGETVTVEEYNAMPPAEQEHYDPAVIQGLDEDTEQTIGTGVGAVNSVVQVVRPFLPEPIGTLVGALFGVGGIASSIWQTVRKKRVKLKLSKTQSVLQDVRTGAEITRTSIDEIVRNSELWNAFKESQKKGASNTTAIMPDRLSEVSLE